MCCLHGNSRTVGLLLGSAGMPADGTPSLRCHIFSHLHDLSRAAARAVT